MILPRRTDGRRRQLPVWVVAGCALAAAAGLGWALSVSARVFFGAYLAGLTFAVSLPVGAVLICLLAHLVGGKWSNLAMRLAVPMARSIGWAAALCLPMLIGPGSLYPWAGAAHEPGVEKVLEHRRPWMSPWWVGGRAVVFFAIVGGVALLIDRWDRDWRARGQAEARRPGAAGVLGIVMLLGVSWMSVDWLLSLQTEMYSSMFGGILYIGQVVNALALVTLASVAVRPSPLVRAGARTRRDLGSLLLAGLCLNAYVEFAQFFIVWNGNLPAEVSWYVPRAAWRWSWLSALVALVRYVLPIGVLVSPWGRRRAPARASVAGLVLFSGVVDAAWRTLPSLELEGEGQAAGIVGAAAAVVLLGGAVLVAYGRALARRASALGADARPARGTEVGRG